MKKNICLLVFLLSSGLAVGLRIYEILSLTEHETGFIIPSAYRAAVIVAVIIVLTIISSIAFTSASAVNGKKDKGFYLVTSLSSLGLGITIAICEGRESFLGIPPFLRLLYALFSILSAVYFISFAARTIVHFPFFSWFAAIPAAFFVFKSAIVAVKYAYYTTGISDTVFEIAAYCFIMLFFLEFARAANGNIIKASIKKFAAFGTAAALLSFSASLPQIVISFVSPSSLHDGTAGAYTLFFAGLYIASEVFSRLSFIGTTGKKVPLYYVGKH